MKYFQVYIIIFLFVSCKSFEKIIDKPVIFDEQRKELTLEYLSERYGLEQELPTITPKMIVLHWTLIPTLEKSFNAFNKVTLPNWRPDIKSVSGLNVSAHFLVNQDGTIYRLLPETTMARHVIGLNHCAIGIENVGGTDEKPLTDKQLEANIWLVNYLANKYEIDYLIGHYEYTHFEGHELWLEKDEGYRTEKTDPGVEFLDAVKLATLKQGFKPTPQKKRQ